ncbi:MAG: hypothetical protein ABSH38_18750 [Verrucomicrobiota bacterium]|jgi:hypothetical protein
MNDQNFFDLAMKAIARQASDAERAELDALLTGHPELKAEFDRLQVDVRTAKETLALVNATKATEPELPAYVRGRLQTKVRQALGRPKVSDERERELKMIWNWRWILGLATCAAAVVLLLYPVRTRPSGAMIQVAMLDTVGTVRGSETSEAEILKQEWKSSSIQSFDSPALLGNWETNWPKGSKVIAKVVYDRAAGEVRVSLHGTVKLPRRTFVVERDLPTTLQEANAFIQEHTKH